MTTSEHAQELPDYRERLKYGTDQGRWLAEEVGCSKAETKQRRSRSQRAYLDIDEHEPRASSSSSSSSSRPPRRSDVDVPSWLLLAAVAVLAIFMMLALHFLGLQAVRMDV